VNLDEKCHHYWLRMNLIGDDDETLSYDEMNDVIEVDHKNHYQNNFDWQKEVVQERMEKQMVEAAYQSQESLQENQSLVQMDFPSILEESLKEVEEIQREHHLKRRCLLEMGYHLKMHCLLEMGYHLKRHCLLEMGHHLKRRCLLEMGHHLKRRCLLEMGHHLKRRCLLEMEKHHYKIRHYQIVQNLVEEKDLKIVENHHHHQHQMNS
jgi:hypothetical protein